MTRIANCIRIGFSISIALIVLTGCGHQEEKDEHYLLLPEYRTNSLPSEVVATIGKNEISEERLRNAFFRRGIHRLDEDDIRNAKAIVLEELVQFELAAAAGEARGYMEDPEIKEKIRQLLATKYWREVGHANGTEAEVSETDVKAYYDEHHDEYRQPRMVSASFVGVRKPSGSDARRIRQLKAETEDLRIRARGKDEAGFLAISREFSTDSAAKRLRGKMGWVTRERDDYRFDRRLVESAFALDEVGEVSPLIETKRGFYFVQLVGEQDGGPTPLSLKEREIRSKLRSAKRQEVRTLATEALRSEIDIKVDWEAVDAIGVRSGTDIASTQPPSFPVGVPSGVVSQ